MGGQTGTVMLAAALGMGALAACSGGGGNNASATANAPESAAATAPASPPVPAGPTLGPLTAQQICDGLSAAAVGQAIGHEVTEARPVEAATPQCSYGYSTGTSRGNVTIAYQRPAEDLGGNAGSAGFDYAVEQNLRYAPDTPRQPIQAGQRAVRLSGAALRLGVVLTSGRVMTVIVNADMPAEAAERLTRAAAEAFSR